MSSPPAPRGVRGPPSLPFLPDEILGEIFLRLDAAEDLARASAACKSYRRLVCDPRFLRRFRFLHPPPVLGFFRAWGGGAFRHAEPPHRSASAARALAQAVDLTCSFLPAAAPDSRPWQILDASGGRLLLCSDSTAATRGFSDLVVCDPLHRRYVRIPPIPSDLTTGNYGWFFFLAPAGEEESPVRVICMSALREGKIPAFVFSSATGTWRGVTFDGWRGNGSTSTCFLLTSCRYYPKRSLCWTCGAFSEVLMLDAHKMEFSVVRIPRVHWHGDHAIVEAGEGRLGFLTLGEGTLDVYSKTWQGNAVGSEEWQHEKTIPLPDSVEYTYSGGFCGAGEGYMLLQAIPRGLAISSQHKEATQYFTLKLKTLLVERLCVSKRVRFAHLYANFLPPFSLPSV